MCQGGGWQGFANHPESCLNLGGFLQKYDFLLFLNMGVLLKCVSLAAFIKRAHEPFYRIVCYVATLSLSVTSRAASLQCIRNFSRITTEINIVNTVQENFGCCVVILGSIGLK